MTRIVLSATPCKFESTSLGTRVVSYPLTQIGSLGNETIAVRKCDEIDAAMAAFRDRIEHPGSFFISARLLNGERAPAGFRKRTFKLEVDRDPKTGEG